ncbi:MAG: hypothetical protein EA378_03885 [Phycisphaerales bacterium]|nr:MAG: hypothetical protein EA378_03885 [Phycisphaerales bacterium]
MRRVSENPFGPLRRVCERRGRKRREEGVIVMTRRVRSMEKVGRCAAAAALVGVAGFAMANKPFDEATEYEKQLVEIFLKDPESEAGRRAYAELIYRSVRSPAEPIGERVIYGEDDRKEVWEYDTIDPVIRSMSDAGAVVIPRSSVVDNGDGTYTLLTGTFGTNFCADEPFRGQPTIGNCSAWFVGDDIIVTAGHCISASSVGNWGYLFGFEIDTEGGNAPTVVSADDVYWITEIIDRELGGGYDHTVSRVDRPVVGRAPVRIARDTPPPVGTELVMIGHPAVMPKKIAGGAEVKSLAGADTFLRSNLDAYGGNSGSMVIRMDTYEVVGILVRGAPDYRTRPGAGCTESNRVPDTGNTGSGLTFEEVSLTMRFQDFIPEVGLAVLPGGNTTHIGTVGGPFSNASTVYTLSNPTPDAIDYAVSFSNPDGAYLLDGSSSAPAGGTLAGGGSAQFELTIAPGAATLSRGIYEGVVTFFDLDNGVANERLHRLEIGQTLISVSPSVALVSGGPEGGPFNATQVYTVTNERPTPVEVGVSGSASWISASESSFVLAGVGEPGSTADVTVGFSSEADSLPSGLYQGYVSFVNMDTDGETRRDVTLDVGRFLYASTDTPLPINDNSSFNSTIVVPDTYCVGDLEVDIDITHTFIGDLRVILTNPTGVSVTLHDRTGGGADDIVRRYSVSEPADGPGSMSDFEGLPVGGTWTLNVSDNAGGDTGTLNSWSLRPQTSGAQCPPIALDGSASGATNSLISFDLNAIAAGSGNISYVVTSLPGSGILWDGNDSITSVPHAMTEGSSALLYRPAVDDSGSYSFTFYATEDGNDSGEATQTISIGSSGVVFEENMDSNPGWTTEGEWAWGQPTASGGNPSSGATGPNVYGYNLNGAYPNNLPVRHLTTTAIDASGFFETSLRFQRWLGVEHSTFDQATIEVSSNGSDWTEIWRNPAGFGNTIIDTAWTEVEYDISAVADGASTLYIRWGMGPTDGSVTYSGWNIDDVQLVALLPVGCAADLTGPALDGVPDGLVTVADLNYFIGAWLASEPIADMTGPALDGVPDGLVTTADLNFYINLFLDGCD